MAMLVWIEPMWIMPKVDFFFINNILSGACRHVPCQRADIPIFLIVSNLQMVHVAFLLIFC